MYKEYGIGMRYFPSICFLVSVVLIGVACSTETESTTISSNSQEFLNQDIDIVWSTVQLVEPEYTSWFGSFAFAVVLIIENEFVINGHFDPGLPVTLIGYYGYPSHQGVSLDQGSYSGGMFDDILYTRLQIHGDLPVGDSQDNQGFLFAIVGEIADYEVVPLWPCPIGSYSIAEAVSSASSLVYRMHETGQTESSLSECCENPEMFRFFSGESNGIMVSFQETGSFSSYLLRTYVVVVNNNAFVAEVGTAGTPVLFRVNGELFLAAQDIGYHCGILGQFIIHLKENGKIWVNYDWSV